MRIYEELNTYLQDRWEGIPEGVKKLLNLRDREATLFLSMLWTRQFYDKKIGELEVRFPGM